MKEVAPSANLGLIAGAGALFALMCIAGLVVEVRACTSGDKPTAAAGPADNATVAIEGQRAPGTAELRALGCDPAIVVDMARLLGGAAHIEPGEPRTMITCDVAATVEAPPGCDRVAATYFRAVGGTVADAVAVRVLRMGSPTPACSRLYAPTGADLGTFPRVR
jgi:hypothetical protein